MSTPALVLITTSFPIVGDGSEAAGSFVVDLAEELAMHLPVRVVAPGRASGQERWSEGIEVFRYATPSRPLSTLKPWRANDLWCIARILRGGLEATRAAAAGGVVHILALWGLPCGEWARKVASEQGIGYSVWMLGSDVWSLGKVPVVRGMLAKVIRRATRAYADGYKLAEDARRIAGVPVNFLPSTRRIGLNKSSIPRDNPPYRLLFLGRWHPNKGVDLLLEALELLEDNDWQLIERIEIQGGGPLESLVRARVEVLRERGHPVEAGRFLTKPEAEKAIASSDWVLIPSRIESIPIVFSDAMKSRRPIIAMPVGDMPRLLSLHEVGHLASGVGAGEFAHALSTALHDRASRFERELQDASDCFSIEKNVVVKILQALPERWGGISV